MLYREYRYRSLFHVSHEQFLDEPSATVDWMLQLDSLTARLHD